LDGELGAHLTHVRSLGQLPHNGGRRADRDLVGDPQRHDPRGEALSVPLGEQGQHALLGLCGMRAQAPFDNSKTGRAAGRVERAEVCL
jgi:hypothetical protein